MAANVTYKNYKAYLDASDEKTANLARRIKYLIDTKQMDPKTGKPLKPKAGYTVATGEGQDVGANISATQLQMQQVKEWEIFDQQFIANAQARRSNPNIANRDLPFPNLKQPSFPRPMGMKAPSGTAGVANEGQKTTNNYTTGLDSTRYTAMGMAAGGTPMRDEQGSVLGGALPGKVSEPTTPTTTTKTKTKTKTKTSSGTSTSSSSLSSKSKKLSGSIDSKVAAINKSLDDILTALNSGDRKTAVQELLASSNFMIPESLLEKDPALRKVIQDFIDGKITPDTLKLKIASSKTVSDTALEYRKRLYRAEKYDTDISGGKASAQDLSNSEFGIALRDTINVLRQEAKDLGATIDDGNLEAIARKLWLSQQDESAYARRVALSPFIKFGTDLNGNSTLFGEAGQNFRDLTNTLRRNGFTAEQAKTVYGKSIDDILRDIASGNVNINDYYQKARNLASLGMGAAVKNLLATGVDLMDIADPYIRALTDELEITSTDEVDLNDPNIRAALSGDNEMNLYDFTKQLRKDSRWQYTKKARDNVYGSALNILRDFGFTG